MPSTGYPAYWNLIKKVEITILGSEQSLPKSFKAVDAFSMDMETKIDFTDLNLKWPIRAIECL